MKTKYADLEKVPLSRLRAWNVQQWIENAPFLAVDGNRTERTQKMFIFTVDEPDNVKGNVGKVEITNYDNAKKALKTGSKKLVRRFTPYGYIIKP